MPTMTTRGISQLCLAGVLAACVLSGCRKNPPPPLAPVKEETSTVPSTSPVPAEAPSPSSPSTPRPTTGRSTVIRPLEAILSRNLPKAGRFLKRAAVETLRQMRSEPAAYVRAGDRALERGSAATAVKCFRRAVALDRNSPDALKGLATALTAVGRHEDALAIYDGILRLCPRDRTARFNRAVALSRLRRFTEAEQAFAELLEEDEDFLKARYNLAALYHADGRLGQARNAWRQVITRAPGLASAHAALGQVLMELGEPVEAMRAFSEVAKRQPGSPGAWMDFATAARAAGSCGRAVVAVRRALKLSPPDAALWRRGGMLLLEAHRATGKAELLAEAVRAWRKSLQLDPAQERLRELTDTYEKAVKGG